MVLQQGIKIPVWGLADAGEAVTVTLGDHTARTVTGADGKWRVNLEPMPPGSVSLTLTVTGKNSLKFGDVLVGDVWICSGQSNMELALNLASNAATEIPKADDSQLRLFVVLKKIALDPEYDFKGEWQICTPAMAAKFSAVGYFFGHDLRQKYNYPVGLIASYWGGTPAQSWTSLSGLQKDPPFTNYIGIHEKAVADFPAANEAYPKLQADYLEQKKQWDVTDGPFYETALKQWNDAAAQANASGQSPPARPQSIHPMPRPPELPQGGPHSPVVLYNGMIAPMIPYAIKGVIWYQGEANAGNGLEYRTLFPRMITDWREKWNQGNFPFLFVQLASLGAPQVKPSEGGWALLREAQLMTLALPNTGMAVAIDIGNPYDIHPKDKIDVAKRLFLAARHVAYGEELVYSGPIYDTMKVEGDKIRLSFKEVGSGLQMSIPPWTSTGVLPPAPTELRGFTIAGADKKWVWANAQIEGNQIIVSNGLVPEPVAVRYGWGPNPPCNLYNKEGLPASPFRTDDWAEPTKAPRPPVPVPVSNSTSGTSHEPPIPPGT